MTNPFSTDALVPTWAAVGVLKGGLAKSREQSAHHKNRAKRHRLDAKVLFTNGFVHASSLHSQAASAHDEAAEATKGSEDNSAYGDAIEAANDASGAAEGASAAASTGFASTSSGTSGE